MIIVFSCLYHQTITTIHTFTLSFTTTLYQVINISSILFYSFLANIPASFLPYSLFLIEKLEWIFFNNMSDYVTSLLKILAWFFHLIKSKSQVFMMVHKALHIWTFKISWLISFYSPLAHCTPAIPEYKSLDDLHTCSLTFFRCLPASHHCNEV